MVEPDTIIEGFKILGVNAVVLFLIKYFIKQSDKKVTELQGRVKDNRKAVTLKLTNIENKLISVDKRLIENSQMIVQEVITVTKLRRDMLNEFNRIKPSEDSEKIKKNYGRILLIEDQQIRDSALIAKVGRYILRDKPPKNPV